MSIEFRWGTSSDRSTGDASLPVANNTGPYVRRRSNGNVQESSSSSSPSTVVSVTSSVPSATANVTVTSDDSLNGRRRSNIPPNRDEEAEAQRKHRSAQARRERRSTQSVTVDDIKAAEQQIKDTTLQIPQPMNNLIENNKIGSPTSSAHNEHDVETERLQKLIEEKKDQSRRTNEVRLLIDNHLLQINNPHTFIIS